MARLVTLLGGLCASIFALIGLIMAAVGEKAVVGFGQVGRVRSAHAIIIAIVMLLLSLKALALCLITRSNKLHSYLGAVVAITGLASLVAIGMWAFWVVLGGLIILMGGIWSEAMPKELQEKISTAVSGVAGKVAERAKAPESPTPTSPEQPPSSPEQSPPQQ